MIIEVKIPSPGESISEVELVNWLVDNGAYVEKDMELAEIESDKASLPILASESGQIEILIPAGTTAKVGHVACKIDTLATAPNQAQNQSAKAKSPQIEVATSKTKSAPIAMPNQSVSSSLNIKNEKAEPVVSYATPLAQQMMEAYELSYDDVINGLKKIGKREIEAVLTYKNNLSHTNPAPKANSREEQRSKMSPLRKKLSQRLVAVKNETAMLTTFNEVDMLAIMNLRKQFQSEFQKQHGIKLGFMSFFTKACALALMDFPMVNSMIDGEEIVSSDYCDIGVAVQTEKGLMVPVLRNVEHQNLADIEKNIALLAEKARSKKISLDELQGGTFTISNGGIFGSMLSTPIINPPQSGILGMHNIIERPVAINGQVEIRPMMYLALSYDHRIIDGRDSVGFLVRVKNLLENPYEMINNGKKAYELLLDL